jgi:hypothetical protein
MATPQKIRAMAAAVEYYRPRFDALGIDAGRVLLEALWRLDAKQAPKNKFGEKRPGIPCGKGYISWRKKCGEDNAQAAQKRLKGTAEGKAYAERVRKSKGLKPRGGDGVTPGYQQKLKALADEPQKDFATGSVFRLNKDLGRRGLKEGEYRIKSVRANSIWFERLNSNGKVASNAKTYGVDPETFNIGLGNGVFSIQGLQQKKQPKTANPLKARASEELKAEQVAISNYNNRNGIKPTTDLKAGTLKSINREISSRGLTAEKTGAGYYSVGDKDGNTLAGVGSLKDLKAYLKDETAFHNFQGDFSRRWGKTSRLVQRAEDGKSSVFEHPESKEQKPSVNNASNVEKSIRDGEYVDRPTARGFLRFANTSATRERNEWSSPFVSKDDALRYRDSVNGVLDLHPDMAEKFPDIVNLLKKKQPARKDSLNRSIAQVRAKRIRQLQEAIA